MKAKRSFRNVISATLFQGTVLILGFIIPKLTINNYGSEINGFMSLVSQIYVYFTLLEAGIGTPLIQALYYPILKNDKNQISGIVNAGRAYYIKIATYYSAAVLIFSLLLPFFLKTDISKKEIFAYFLIFGVSNIVNFLVAESYKLLLIAEGKSYVDTNIRMIFHTILQIAKVVMIAMCLNIVVLQTVYSAINMVQIAVYLLYFRKNYSWIDKSAAPLFEKIKQRGAFFAQQISDLVFSCTDIVIISFFCNLKMASVYAIYMMIYNVIRVWLSNISSSTKFILGQTYAEGNKEKYLKIHRAYESVFVTVSSIVFTSVGILAIPFLRIYTNGITDANYIDIVMPLMLSANSILSAFRTSSIHLINISFNAKKAMPRSILEAAINLVLTLIFVPIWGIRGALLGTGIALIYRVIDLLFYANREILKTSVRKPLVLYLSNFFAFLLMYTLGTKQWYTANTYFDLFPFAIIVFFVTSIVFVGINFVIDIGQGKYIYKYAYMKITTLKKKNAQG